MSGLAVDFDRYIAAYESGISDKDYVVDAEDIVHDTANYYRKESDFGKQPKRPSNKKRSFPLPVDYSYRQNRNPVTLPKHVTTEVQEMPVVKFNDLDVKLDDLEVSVVSELSTSPTTPSPTSTSVQSVVVKPSVLPTLASYLAADNKIDLINLAEASMIAPMLKAVGKSLYIPFALELCEIGEIRSDTCIDSEVWGDMCPVEIKGIGGSSHTVNLPSSSGVYIASTYLAKQLGEIFILRNSSFTMDLMMRRDSGQIEIGHRLQSPTGMTYGTVIHYGTIASHKDTVGEVWMLVQRITDGWHIPMKTQPVKTVLTGSSQIAKAAIAPFPTPAPHFDARVSTKEIKAIKNTPQIKIGDSSLYHPPISKFNEPYPLSY